MKKIFFVLVFLNMLLTTVAQNHQWSHAVGSASSDCGYSIVNDASGNTYVTGVFNGVVDFDPGPGSFTLSSGGLDHAFVMKLSSNGQFVWAKQFDGISSAVSVCLDASGNIYTSGTYSGSVDFDPDAGVAVLNSVFSTVDAFVCKLDTGGHYLWAKGVGGVGTDEGRGIGVDPSGNIYTTGSFEVVVDFDPGPAQFIYTVFGGSAKDIFLLKLDASGNFVWAKDIGGTNFEEPYDLKVDASGNCYMTGYFNGVADFDPSASTFTVNAGMWATAFVAKYNASGNFQWVYNTASTFYTFGFSVAVDFGGDVYATGLYSGTCDFDPGFLLDTISSNAASDDAFLVKLNSNGIFQWARAFGGIDLDFGRSVMMNTLGEVCVAGNFRGTVDFDPGPLVNVLGGSSFFSDVFISSFSPTGSLNWARRIGGPGQDNSQCISGDLSGSLYVTGCFSDSAVFNYPFNTYTLQSQGVEDLFVSKFSNCASPLGAINGSLSFCGQAGTTTYSVLPVSGASGYTWTVPAGVSILSGQSTNAITLNLGTLSGSFSVNAFNACSFNPPATANVSVFAVAQLTTSSSNTQICAGESVSLSVSGGQTYTWSTGQSGSLIVVSPTLATTYSVVGTGPGGCEASKTFLQRVSQCVGVEEKQAMDPSVRIYPNPTEGNIWIETPNTLSNLKIYSPLGVLLGRQDALEAGVHVLDLNAFEKGMYVFEWESQGKRRQLKVLKN